MRFLRRRDGELSGLYVFVIMEAETRRIAHFNVTAHPTADWTLKQFREGIAGEKAYRFLIHDRDNIHSSELDSALKAVGLSTLKTARLRRRFLRTSSRNHPPGVFGFPDSAE